MLVLVEVIVRVHGWNLAASAGLKLLLSSYCIGIRRFRKTQLKAALNVPIPVRLLQFSYSFLRLAVTGRRKQATLPAESPIPRPCSQAAQSGGQAIMRLALFTVVVLTLGAVSGRA